MPDALNISLTREENRKDNQSQFADFSSYLHRGGKLAYIWTRYEGGAGGDSLWWEVGVDPIPDITVAPKKLHTYFSVHPLWEVPKTNKSGDPAEAHRVRGRITHVAAINCVYADLDAKDFSGWQGLLEHVKTIKPKPSAVVNTGYGLHLYWLLDQPFRVYGNAQNLKRASALQYRWQEYTKSDPGAKDLARVLRVPGTDNWKHETRKPCRFKRLDYQTVYTIDQLESFVAFLSDGSTDEIAEVRPIQDMAAEIRKAQTALSLLHPIRADERDSWVEIGMSLRQLGDAGFGLWDEWSQQSSKYDHDDCLAKWKSFEDAVDVQGRKPVTLATLYYHARTDAAHFSPEDEATLVGLLDEATDPQATIVQRRKAKQTLAERLIWFPADVQAEIRDEAKRRRWSKADFDEALTKATQNLQQEDEAEDIDAFRLSQFWLAQYPDTLRAGGEWFRFADGIWTVRDDELVYRELAESAQDAAIEARISTLDGAAKLGRAFATHRDPGDWNPDRNLLVVENGVLDISTDPPQFSEWSNQVFNRVRMPVVYDPDAQVSVYWKALRENLGSVETVRFFLEFAGLALAEISDFEVSPWLSGPPGGGKSTILSGLNAVMGDYASAVDLDRLDSYAHGRTMLLDKKLIYAYEVDARFLTHPGSLSAIISHEPIQINPKGKPEYTYKPRCAVMFAVNELPGVSNPESGLFRRIKVVPIEGRDSKDHDPGIRYKIEHDPVERSGMLNLFIDGLRAVRKRGLMVYPQTVQDATRDWHIDNDKVRLHIIERCELGTGKSVQATTLYNDFKAWCRNSGVRPYGITAWGRRMASLRYSKSKRGGIHWYHGLQLRPQPSQPHAVQIELGRAGTMN